MLFSLSLSFSFILSPPPAHFLSSLLLRLPPTRGPLLPSSTSVCVCVCVDKLWIFCFCPGRPATLFSFFPVSYSLDIYMRT